MLGLVFCIGACGGCHPLSGTTWVLTEVEAKSEEEQSTVEGIRSLAVQFGLDGRLQTTVQRKDGSFETEDDESYEIRGDTILIRHPDYEKRVNYKLVNGLLEVSSDRFEAKFEPYRRPVAERRPAMFRPSSLGRQEYRRINIPGRL